MVSVLVCGGGSAAQVVSTILGQRYRVTALSLSTDEADRWQQATQHARGMTVICEASGKVIKASPDLITNDPSFAKDCDVVLFTVASSEHEKYLQALSLHVKEGAIFAMMPARSGCDFLFKKVMGHRAGSFGLVACETLPWACQIKEWGKAATLRATRETVSAAVLPASGKAKHEVVQKLQGLLGVKPRIVELPNVLTISLGFNPGQVVHTGITYGKWKNWDGKPRRSKELFYQGVDEFTAKVLTDLSDEIREVCSALKRIDKRYDLSQVRTIMEWYMDTYAQTITDPSSLKTAMNTNTAYEGLCHPMKAIDGKGYEPDFKYRYLSEDVPTGLCFTKGVACLVEVKTPTIDQVILWSQTKLGKEFITQNGDMAGADLALTRAPQACGVNTRKELQDFLGIPSRQSKSPSCLAGLCICGA